MRGGGHGRPRAEEAGKEAADASTRGALIGAVCAVRAVVDC